MAGDSQPRGDRAEHLLPRFPWFPCSAWEPCFEALASRTVVEAEPRCGSSQPETGNQNDVADLQKEMAGDSQPRGDRAEDILPRLPKAFTRFRCIL
jgi:hypothetical protein